MDRGGTIRVKRRLLVLRRIVMLIIAECVCMDVGNVTRTFVSRGAVVRLCGAMRTSGHEAHVAWCSPLFFTWRITAKHPANVPTFADTVCPCGAISI